MVLVDPNRVDKMDNIITRDDTRVADVNEVKELSRTTSIIQDEPFGGFPTIAYSKIFRQARQDNVLVLLDGQGMDEQWAGYDYYRGGDHSDTIQGQRRNFSPFNIKSISNGATPISGTIRFIA